MKQRNVSNVDIVKGSLLGDMSEMICYKGGIDLISINMVLHHLDTDHEDFPNYRKALTTLIPFLKPGGKVCINSFYRE